MWRREGKETSGSVGLKRAHFLSTVGVKLQLLLLACVYGINATDARERCDLSDKPLICKADGYTGAFQASDSA